MTRSERGEQTERTSPEEAAELRPSGSSRVSLLLFHREGATMVPLRAGEPIVVGRDAAADTALDDSSLSRHHARFTLQDSGQVTIEDLGSTNGTWVGGRRVERAEIGPGAEATLGRVIVSVHRLAPGDHGPAVLQRHDEFRHALDSELARARFFARPLAFALIRPVGNDGTPLRRWSPVVQQRLRPVDQVAVYGRDTLEVLISEMTAEEAARFLSAVTSDPRMPTLGCGIASFPVSGRSADELIEAAHRALAQATPDTRVKTPSAARAVVSDTLVATSPRMRQLLQTIERVAQSAIPLLLVGETGSGKEAVARYLHSHGPRRDKPMLCVNCGAIPSQLVESTLFGHERGAFTGALQQQQGVFEAASGGFVFLDEVGELPLEAQTALLRVLETKRIYRVGSTKELEVDVRVLAATHRDLEAMVREKLFRQDLLYRLNAMTVVVPPLRERREDIAALAQQFLAHANAESRLAIEGFEPDALELLQQHRWPGNVRELRNAVERAVVLCDGRLIRVEDLPMELASAGCPSTSTSAESGPQSVEPAEGEDHRTRMDRMEAEILTEALRDADWNQRVAARRLGLPLRTLVYKIRRLNLKRSNAVAVRPRE